LALEGPHSMSGRNPFIGKTIGRWTLESELGRGGMGVVMLARSEDGTPAAVKLLSKDVAKNQQYISRFEREAQVLEHVEHPNILKVFETGRTPEGLYYICMELVDGKSLGDVIKTLGSLRPDQSLAIVSRVADGLHAAHRRNIIHRDIKPDNILIDRAGTVKISDFGLAKDTSDNQKLTLTGQVIGTPAFMSPEQAMGEKADHRSDIYALGVTLFYMLSGRRPFSGATPLDVVMKHIHEPVPDLEALEPGLPPRVYETVRAMMAKKAGDRPQEAGDVAGALKRIADESGWDLTKVPPTLVEDDVERTLDDVPGLKGVVDRAIHEDETRPTIPAEAARADRVADEELPGSTSDPRVGTLIAGKYQVRSLLGEGGMGSVYLVRHKDLGVDYALKILRSDLVADESFRERFLREAKSATSFVHKHAIQIRDFGLDQELLYMTMDYSRGRTLQEILEEEGVISEKRAASITAQILLALKEAHAAGLIHRDLKPANIMIEGRAGEDFVRILDFGVAKTVDEERDAADGLSLTRTGTVVGTLQYMSPEQAAGGKIDARSDLYAVSAILYEALSGERPVDAENPQQMIYKLAVEEPKPLSARMKGVSRPLERLIMKNLDKRPDKRSASASEFLAELYQCSEILHSEILVGRAGVPWLWPALLGGALLLAAAVVLLLALDPFGTTETGPARGSGTSPSQPSKTPPPDGGTGTPGETEPGPSPDDREEERNALLATGREALDKEAFDQALASFREAERIRRDEEVIELIATAKYRKAMQEGSRALEAKDYRKARDRAFLAQKAALTTRQNLRAKEMLETADRHVQRAEALFEEASAFFEKDEILKALPPLETYAASYPKGKRLEAVATMRDEILKRLEAFQGLIVRSEPAGADVMVDGREVGTTPLMLADVEPGPHTLMFDLKGYKLKKTEVEYAGERAEVSVDLTAGAFATLRVLGDEKITVAYGGTVAGPLPRSLSGVSPGKGTIRVRGPQGAAYDVAYACEPGETCTVTVDFEKLKAEEENAFRNLPRGETLAGTRDLFEGFLEAYPAGVHHETVRAWLRDLEAEAALIERVKEGDPASRAEAARRYLRAYGSASYPAGWYTEEARRALAEAEQARDDRAFEAILETTTLAGRKRAVEEYLDAFPDGAHRDEATRLYNDLKEEEQLLYRFDLAADYGEKTERGRAYLARYAQGFDAERVRREIETLQKKESTAFQAVFSVDDPREIASRASDYLDAFADAKRAPQVREAWKDAEAELEALSACGTEKGCRLYLLKFPDGFFVKEVEARLARFGWKQEEVRGIPQPARLEEGMRKGGSPGEYVGGQDDAPMVFVPGGIYPLGSSDYFADEEARPQVYVYVGPFYLDKFEVTNRRYARFLEWSRTADDPRAFSHPLEKAFRPEVPDRKPALLDRPGFDDPDQPVVGVDWFDAWAYARWAGKTLPNEAQWEIAASCNPATRAKRRYPWGDTDPSSGFAVWGADAPRAVGNRPAGACPFGAEDMAGNVAEWCLDAYAPNRWETLQEAVQEAAKRWTTYRPLRYVRGASSDPHTRVFRPGESPWSVRGGSFEDDEDDIRTVTRAGETEPRPTIGFRCVIPAGTR